MYIDNPKSLKREAERVRRKALLAESHMHALNEYVRRLRDRSATLEVPDFDPLDGGTNAKVLFLLEKPGPMTSETGKRVGSGFISRNNNDETARNLFEFMQNVGIPRDQTLIWNVIPWWDRTRKIEKQDLLAGLKEVENLLDLLPGLRSVVMVGREAAKARKTLEARGLPVFQSDHPSPLVRARWPERMAAIQTEWAKVKPYLD